MALEGCCDIHEGAAELAVHHNSMATIAIETTNPAVYTAAFADPGSLPKC